MHIGAAIFFTDYSVAPAWLGRELQARGFESCWAPEHSHIPVARNTGFPSGGDLPKAYYDTLDPFVALTAVAAATTTLKIGTGVCLIAQRDPIQTAKLVASIDQISAGRFLFGVGNGWNREEMENHGTNFAGRHKLARERIEAMKEIWTKSKAEYHGESVNFDPIFAWPKPTQRPHPPVYVGGAFPYGARRAIRYGSAWMPHRARPQYPDVVAKLPEYQALLAESGLSMADRPVSVWGGKPDLDALRRDRDAGVVRVIMTLPSAGAEEVLPRLDRWAEVIHRLA